MLRNVSLLIITMGKQKQTRKFAAVKRIINPKDARLTVNEKSKDIKKVPKGGPQEVSSLN